MPAGSASILLTPRRFGRGVESTTGGPPLPPPQSGSAIHRRHSIYDVTWSHNDAGEDSLLIYGTVITE